MSTHPNEAGALAADSAEPRRYRIGIVPRPAYLFVTVDGENTVETIRRYSKDVREACVTHRRTRVLIVVNLQGPKLSMLDVYKAVETGSDEAAGIGLRVAYVDLRPAPSTENMQIAEDVAATRGIPVRTFTDLDAAEAWLLGDGDA
jgi:hypothetical protein